MTQNERLLNALRKGRTVTRLTAMMDLGIQNLTARVSDLRAMGYDVVAEIEHDLSGREFAKYRLIEPRSVAPFAVYGSQEVA